MAKPSVFKKILKWLGLTVLFLIIATSVYLQFFFLPQIRVALEDRLNEDFAGAYTFKIEDLDANLLRKEVEFYNVTLTANPAFFDTNTTHPYAFNVAVEHYKMNLGNVIALSKGQAIDVDVFKLDNPTINLAKRRVVTSKTDIDTTATVNTNALTQAITIDSFDIVNANIYLEENLFDTHYIAKSEDIDISINHFSFKSGDEYHIDYGYIAFSMRNLYFPLNDVMEASIESIEFDTRKNTNFRINGFGLKPTVDIKTYTQYFGKRVPYIKAKVKTAKIVGIDQALLSDFGSVNVQGVYIQDPEINLVADANLIPIDSNAFKPMLNHVLMSINQPYNIEEVKIENIKFYGEITPEGYNGVIPITVNEADILLSNLNNSDLESPVVLDLRATLHHKSEVKAVYTIDKDTINYGWRFYANVNHIDLVDYNKALSATNFNIKSGEIDNLEVNISGDDQYSIGDVHFVTSNVRLKQDSHEERGMLGKAADGIVVFGGNTFLSFKAPKDGKLYSGKIHFKRQAFRSPLHMIIGGVGSGFGNALSDNQETHAHKQKKKSKEHKSVNQKKTKKKAATTSATTTTGKKKKKEKSATKTKSAKEPKPKKEKKEKPVKEDTKKKKKEGKG